MWIHKFVEWKQSEMIWDHIIFLFKIEVAPHYWLTIYEFTQLILTLSRPLHSLCYLLKAPVLAIWKPVSRGVRACDEGLASRLLFHLSRVNLFQAQNSKSIDNWSVRYAFDVELEICGVQYHALLYFEYTRAGTTTQLGSMVAALNISLSQKSLSQSAFDNDRICFWICEI